MSKASATILAGLFALTAPAPAQAEPAVVGLARAYLGPQSTLDGIRSIHYVGTLDRFDPDHSESGTVHTALDLIFVKPLKQRLVVRGPKVTMTTVLDGYDGWDFLRSNEDASKYRLTWLPANDIRTLRANTWENLYYFRSPEGGSAFDKGPAKIDGIDCERVDFAHSPDTVYERYFDRDTGRLVLTVRGAESFRESGEIRVDGIRFPKTIVSVTKTASGKELVSTATFETIVLDEPLGADVFAVPNLPLGKPAQAPVGAPRK
jgi:hypothetical protein